MVKKLPDLPGKVHGVKCMDPFTVQCDDCLEVWTAGGRADGITIFLDGRRLPDGSASY